MGAQNQVEYDASKTQQQANLAQGKLTKGGRAYSNIYAQQSTEYYFYYNRLAELD